MLPVVITLIAAATDAFPDVAVTVAVPRAMARTSPESSTVATEESLDDHMTAAPTTSPPSASRTIADRRRVSPTSSTADSGVIATVATACTTVTAASSEAEPEVAAIVAVPLPAAVTRPEASTVATATSELAQATDAPDMARPNWSRTSADIWAVSPSAVNSSESGVRSTVVGTAARTTTDALPATPDAVAVISTSPAATPVTSPAPSTTATSVSADAHSNSAPATVWPFASTAAADRRRVSASTRESAGGVTVTVFTTWSTVIEAVPDAAPDVAVIVAVPLPAAVTTPTASTGATEGSEEDHATVAPAIGCPFWSRTSAVNCIVSPMDARAADVGATDTVVATGAGGGTGSVPESPHDRKSVEATATSAAARARISEAPGLPHGFPTRGSDPHCPIARFTCVS